MDLDFFEIENGFIFENLKNKKSWLKQKKEPSTSIQFSNKSSCGLTFQLEANFSCTCLGFVLFNDKQYPSRLHKSSDLSPLLLPFKK